MKRPTETSGDWEEYANFLEETVETCAKSMRSAITILRSDEPGRERVYEARRYLSSRAGVAEMALGKKFQPPENDYE